MLSFLSKKQKKAEATESRVKQNKQPAQNAAESNKSLQPQKVAKKNKVTEATIAKSYNDPRSIIDFLPVVEYLSDSENFLLNDGRSVMKVFDAHPLPTEGRSEEWLIDQRNKIQDIIQDVFDEYSEGEEWLIWTYAYFEDNLDEYIDLLRAYPVEHAKDTEYTKTYLDIMESHLRGVSKEQGIFHDETVTDSPWSGSIARLKICIYRRIKKSEKFPSGVTPITQINDVAKKFTTGLKTAGIGLQVVDGKTYYDWMLQWFNPSPQITNGDKHQLRKMAAFNDNDDLPIGDDFSESFFFEAPRSSLKHKCWVFDGKPHRFLRIHKLRRLPRVGCLTGEIASNDDSSKAASLMDKLPPGSVIVSGIIVSSQDSIHRHIEKIEGKSKGDSADAEHARDDCAVAKKVLAKRQKLYRGMMGIYLRADNMKELRKASIDASQHLLNQGLQPIMEENETVALDAYLLHMPGVFEPSLDKNYKLTRPIWAQHLINLSGFFGRNTGTGHPGLMMFNRGGECFCVDPMSLKDRAKNAHAIINGPTGSGKSASLTSMAAHIMAVHRPRLFMLELGNSFGLLGDFFKANGLTVNKLQITPEKAKAGLVNFAPFADAYQLLELDERELLGSAINSDRAMIEDVVLPETTIVDGQTVNVCDLPSDALRELKKELVLKQLSDEIADQSPVTQSDKQETPKGNEVEQSEQRDVMGECEIVATLMITGGEPEETKKLSRADRRMIRDAILKGARQAYSEGRSTIVSDVCDGFKSISLDDSIPEKRRERAYDMGEAMRMFTDGFEGDMFNGQGEPWPDVDVTIVDVATLGREGYQAQLAIAYSSILMKVNNIAEKHQHGTRQNLMLTDESHIVTTNPLLSGYIVKIVKTWRKLQTWAWFASQNVKDYPDSAQKLLNMVEFFIMLVMPADEVNDLDRFRPVTPAQKKLMLSATKAHRQYTEGVLLSDRTEALFRMVPPSLMLALAGTEGDEKAERAKYMREFGISEVEAAIHAAKVLDFYRGLTGKPKDPVPDPKYSGDLSSDLVIDHGQSSVELNTEELVEKVG